MSERVRQIFEIKALNMGSADENLQKFTENKKLKEGVVDGN